jgi:glycosyltransferase involved in cell wall biosynthesis
MNIKISVVVPTYQRPALLLKCLRALITQKFNRDEYEILIVSDGPDAATAEVLNKWLKNKLHQVRYLTTPQKKGPAAARNYGWLAARGILIAFTDDDCVPNKNWLNAYWSRYIPGTDTAFTGKVIVPIPKRPTDFELNTAGLQTAEFITANCCCTKNSLEKIGGFDEQFTMAWREDSDLEFKLINQQITISHLDDAVVVHPVRQAPWGISIKEQKKTMFNALLYKKYPTLYRQKIQPQPAYKYYAVTLAFVVALGGLYLKMSALSITGFTIWTGLTVEFIIRRLMLTKRTFNHILEMAITSVAIPFLSLYWQFYGALKYRVLFI